MKKHIILLSTLMIGGVAYSQVGINTETPKTIMDINAKRNASGTITDNSQTYGLQAPRLTRAELTANTASYNADQKGALIYITDVLGGNTSSPRTYIDAEGYYYFDGTLWQKIGAGGAGADINIYKDNGTLTSNRTVAQVDKTLAFTSTATSGTNHFSIDGTTFSVDANNNRVGLGTSTPSTRLHLNNGTTNGAIRIQDGTEGAGKVLTSDANGVGTWRSSSSIFSSTQTVQNVKANRAFGTEYTNNTGNAILVMISADINGTGDFSINGVIVARTVDVGGTSGSAANLTMIVPNNATYKYVATASDGGGGILYWAEFR